MSPDAVQILRHRWPEARPRIALVLGSGWAALADAVQDAQRLPYAALPGFPAPGVQGHQAELVWGRLGGREVALLTGRQHAYETGAVDGMKGAIRCLRQWGCELLIQTNAAGSLRPDMPAGSLMLIADHLNLSQHSPLTGETGSARFVNMGNAYDSALRAQVRQLAQGAQAPLFEGVYAWFLGPQFETPAEIRMLARLGADAVGMSTVPETILARHAGMRVMAFSLLTNMAAGLSDEVLSHAHTLSQAAAASERASGLLYDVVSRLKL